ncbi:hypothetical protein QE418_001170 [Microbacterium testaceum]|nr:hypothetical protein [Microbacterium testaceum]
MSIGGKCVKMREPSMPSHQKVWVGELVRLAPRDLLREEPVEPRELRDLRERGGVAERVGQPDAVRLDAEFVAEEAHALRDLAHHRLAARQVAVGLDPLRAHDDPLARGDRGLDALPHVRVALLHPRVLLRRRRGEAEVGVLLGEGEHVRERAGGLALGLADGPEPRGVDVRVTDAREAVGRGGCRA